MGERVRLLGLKKDETIGALQQQLAAAQRELHVSRQQLHSVQQEMLGME